MELRRLEYFLDLSRTGNYSETAERMYTTQGNISKQIAALEKELGVLLVDRSRRKIRLTEAGEVLLPYAEQLIQTEEKMWDALHRLQSGKEAELRIGALPSFVQYGVPELLAAFQSEHPEIQIEINECEKTALLQKLQEEHYEVIYTRLLDEVGRKSALYEKIVVERDHFAAVLPLQHPLCRKEAETDCNIQRSRIDRLTGIDLKELKNEKFILLDEKTELFKSVYHLCINAGFSPQVVHKSVRIDTILGMVGAGMGVSILMEKSIPKELRSRVQILPLKCTIASELAFVRRSGKMGETLRKFWKFLEIHSYME